MFVALAVLSFALLAADEPTQDEPRQKVQVSKTEQVEFAGGGVIRLDHSIGELSVEGWDRPELEITTIKSSKNEYASNDRESAARMLDQVHIAITRQGGELVINSDFPRHAVLARPFRGETDFDLEYHIRAPRNARLIIDHEMGEVNISEMTGDIHVTDRMGAITLRLPDGKYAIDAKSKIGSVTSDFSGKGERKHFFGHQFDGSVATPESKLYLRVGFGDIILLKMRKPH